MNCGVIVGIVISVLVAIASVAYVLYGDLLVQYVPQLAQFRMMAATDKEVSARDLYLDTPHTRGKINRFSGNYETFGGITCIAPIADRYTNPGWARVYDFIEKDPILSQYYTALPVTSYHMTVHPMFTVSGVPGYTPRKFDVEINKAKKALTAFYNETVDHPFEPRGTVIDTYAQGIIVIAVELDSEDAMRTYQLRKLLGKLTGLDPIENYRQHITLAYRSADFGRQNSALVQESLMKLKSIIEKDVLPNSDGKLLFDKAQLMLFHDMTLFQPTNPMTWSDEPLADLPPTPPEFKMKVKPEGWRAPWL